MAGTTYTIHSTQSEETHGEGDQVLVTSVADKFVASLQNKVIVLKAPPNPTAEFDVSDETRKWFMSLDPKSKVKLTVDDKKAIQSFQLSFATPWNMVFTSASDALSLAFGPSRIPVPGLLPGADGTILVCALDPKGSDIHSTIKGVFEYAGLGGMVPLLPSVLPNQKVTLRKKGDPKNPQRNALWFNPSIASQTTIRLAFRLDLANSIQKVFDSTLKGLTITDADVICKKVMVSAETELGTKVVDTGSVVFSVGCQIQAPKGDVVKLNAGIEFRESTIDLTLKVDSEDALGGIVSWLGGLVGIPDLANSVGGLLGKDGIFSDIRLRRCRIGLDTMDNPMTGTNKDHPSLVSFAVDIEVSATFGRGVEDRPVAFLASYAWNEGDNIGSIKGQLWNEWEKSNSLDLAPDYETWDELRPTGTPATSINLATLVPGQSIENIPDTIPTDITRAYIFLSDTEFSIGGSIVALEPGGSKGAAPQPYLGEISIDAWYAWGKQSAFTLSLGILAGIQPSESSIHTDPATLSGEIKYNSAEKTWELMASLDGLYASTLAEFFDKDQRENVMPLIDSIEIDSLDVYYRYTGQPSTEAAVGKSVGSYFKIDGTLLVAALELDLTFEHKSKDVWTFSADLRSNDEECTVGDIINSILGDEDLDLPDFLADMRFGGEGGQDALSIEVAKQKLGPARPGSLASGVGSGSSFIFSCDIAIGSLQFTFSQFRNSEWPKTDPSKRLVKISLDAFPDVDIPLVGNLAQPFDELYYLWVQDGTRQKPGKEPGLTRKDVGIMNSSLTDQLVPKDKFANPVDTDVLIGAGSHFGVIISSVTGGRKCILDYDFMKPGKKFKKSNKPGIAPPAEGRIAALESPKADGGDEGGSSAHAPFKKQSGPLAIKNLGLKYKDKKLSIMFDATFDLGPIGFSLIGFSVDIGPITSLADISSVGISASIKGLSASFEKPPLSIAGIIRHGNTGELDYYAGGLIVGYVPYQFQAAGFYGKATPPGREPFTSVFIFAKLEGPLITFEFGKITGVTGGFGYNSSVRIPSAAQVPEFPFIAPGTLGDASSALAALEKLTTPDENGWFKPENDTYWAAAGLKITAFEMLSLDAVVLFQFGSSTRLGVFAVGTADIPSASSPVKYAHIELGMAIVADLDYGILKVEAQLSPNSYILHPDCHLTGGCGLYYWFDAPYADKANVGNFVFTLGGYHRAFKVPVDYPNPPRLGISWSMGSALSITGEAYFAITPKTCMGGGRLHASYSAGPLTTWFDAFADFLINFKPFHFMATAGVSVGIRFELDLLFVHTQISVEIGAQLTLWGPPVAGRVHIDFWIAAFDIEFGDSDPQVQKIGLVEFYELVLQASSQPASKQPAALKAGSVVEVEEEEAVLALAQPITRPKNEGHVFLAESGLINKSEDPQRADNAPWVVRGGTFAFVVSCTMAINEAVMGKNGEHRVGPRTVNANDNVFAKPMQLDSPMESKLTVDIKQQGVAESDDKWGMERHMKSVPRGLWGKYDPAADPSGGSNNVASLLNNSDGSVSLMMGLRLKAPPPRLSPDRLPVYNIADASLQSLTAQENFPTLVESNEDWEPGTRADGAKQWEEVHAKWTEPNFGKGENGQAGFAEGWAKSFGWDTALFSKLAAIPKRLEKKFDDLYVAAPLITR